MSKILVSLSLLLVLVGTSIAAEIRIAGTRDLNNDEMAEAFHEFEEYLETKSDLSDSGALNAAKQHIPNRDVRYTFSQRAAKIFVHLNEFEQCDPKAIEYMLDVVRGRRLALPGSMATRTTPRTRLDELLEATLERASGKCKSFVETWFRETENKLEPNTKELLYLFPTHDLVKREDLNKLPEEVTEKILKDENLPKQLSDCDYDQLYRFYYSSLTENVVKPCKNYLDVMSPFVETIIGLGFLTPKPASVLFDKPSNDLIESPSRYDFCSVYVHGSITEKAHWLAQEAWIENHPNGVEQEKQEALDEVEEAKKDVLSEVEEGKKEALSEVEEGKIEASNEAEEGKKDVLNVAEQVQV